jgi:PIN domain nuclease of toxin-antitoxin system
MYTQADPVVVPSSAIRIIGHPPFPSKEKGCDPCDGFIVANALAESLPIVTADETMPRYPGVQVIW